MPCRKALVTDAARQLESCKMARFDEKSGNLYVTELGRVASHFYVKHNTIVIFNEPLKRHMSEAEVNSQDHDTGPPPVRLLGARLSVLVGVTSCWNTAGRLVFSCSIPCVCSNQSRVARARAHEQLP